MPRHYPTPPPPPEDGTLPWDMNVPHTPEQLFEQLAEPTLRACYPSFDSLPSTQQKLIRLLHTELIKGGLTDATFKSFSAFVLHLWRAFNFNSVEHFNTVFTEAEDLEEDWIHASNDCHRLHQALTSALAVVESIPVPPPSNDPLAPQPNQYVLEAPGEQLNL